MPDELTPQQVLIAPVAPGAPTLELDEIQGDVLIGLQKLFERLVFFQIVDTPGFKAALRQKIVHRITAAGKSTEDRGLMFVCYQTSIVNQFEFVQISWADDSGFIFNAKHPDGSVVTTGLDPVIGQNTPGTARVGMDEPVSNYPIGNVRSTLNQPNAFVVPTGGAYFFVPSIAALQQKISA